MANIATRTARNATAIALSTLLARGIQFGWVLVLSRMLGAADLGIYGTIGGMIATAAVIPEFGMGLIVLRDVAQRPAASGRYLSATLVVQPLLALVGYVGLVGVGLLLPYDAATRLLLALAAISLIVDALGNLYYSQLIAVEQMVATSAIMVTHIALLIIFVFVAVVTDGGLAGLYVATILAGLFRVGMHWAAARRAGLRATWPLDLSVVRGLFSGGWPIMLGGLLRSTYQHIDKVIVLATIGEKEAGYLTAAFVIVFGVTELLNTTVLVALFPIMSRMAQDQPGELRRLVDRLAFLTLVISLPLAVGISGLSGKLAELLFPGFTGTASVLQVLIWHTIVIMIGNLYAQVMIIERRQLQTLIIRGSALALNVVLNFYLLPRVGLPGAALAALISETGAMLCFFIAHRPDAATIRDLSGRSARVAAAGAVMAACIWLLRDVNWLIAGIVGTVVYGVLILVLRVLAPEEWAIIHGAAATLPIVRDVFKRLPLPGVP